MSTRQNTICTRRIKEWRAKFLVGSTAKATVGSQLPRLTTFEKVNSASSFLTPPKMKLPEGLRTCGSNQEVDE